MPLFEFRCRNCEHVFETLVRNGEAAACPTCGDARPEKLLSAAGARVSSGGALPMASNCPPASAPPCGPGCCRLP